MLCMIDEDTHYEMKQKAETTRKILIVDDEPLTHLRNIFSRKPVGITVPVKSLVMPFCALGDQGDLVQVP